MKRAGRSSSAFCSSNQNALTNVIIWAINPSKPLLSKAIMQKIINKLTNSCRTIGIPKTIFKLSQHSFNRMFLRYKNVSKKLSHLHSIEDRFTEIYRNNYWGDFESVSGKGSTLDATFNLRSKLPVIFEKFSIKTIFDAPCGDFNWMREVLNKNRINYIGGDIVRPLIESHNTNFQNGNTRFLHVDITKDKFPEADLMICRDCLFHLNYEQTKLALQNYIDSNIPYLLTTTHYNRGEFSNKDIETGSFRSIDLFSAPYHFPKDVLFRIDDSIPKVTQREMCLWSREQIVSAMAKFQ